MIKKLRKQGNSQVLPIDRALMDTMGIDMQTPLMLSLTGNSLVVTPVHVGAGKERLDECLAAFAKEYPEED